MKILITNPDTIIDPKTKQYYPGIEQQLNAFNEKEGQRVVVISVKKFRLDPIPESYYKLTVSIQQRMGTSLIDALKRSLGCEISDLFVLGCKRADVAIAANSKVLLLRADYAKEANSDESIYTKEYGISIKNAVNLGVFFDKFMSIKVPWYYKAEISKQTTIYALTNANTFYRDADISQLSAVFKDLLKNGNNTYQEEFTIYFLVSTYAIVKEFEDVDIWGIYPSSGIENNPHLEYFKEKARQAYNCRKAYPLFIRHTPTVKRHNLGSIDRIKNGSDEELGTIRINPEWGNVKGKTVCVIDDFTNIGSSCETSRTLLEAAGAKKIIFITMGKFGKDYINYQYSLSGDPFGWFKFERGTEKHVRGVFNTFSDEAFIKSLGGIIK